VNLGLQGKTVLVTGASQGIGRALAVGLAASGGRIFAVARRRDRLESLLAEIGGAAAGHGCLAIDLCDGQSAPALLSAAGPVDVIIHAAGGNGGVRDLRAPASDWSKVWQLNVGHAIDVNNAFLGPMLERRWGRIVHLSSRVAVELGGAGPYAAAKAYLNAYVGIMGRELAGKGVLINAIMPSAIAAEGNNWSKALRDKPDGVREFLASHQAIGRLGTPDDLLPFVLLLASDANRFAAGSIVSVDGASH
jgi:3-oxoacyl-[acyl-carrier protein] reductase